MENFTSNHTKREAKMNRHRARKIWLLCTLILGVALTVGLGLSWSKDDKPKAPEKESSYSPVVIKEDFTTIMNRMKAEKPKVMARQLELLQGRYDLGNHPAQGVTMTRGKPV